MAEADIGEDADGGPGHAGEPGHLPKIADAHFQDCGLVLLPDTENRKGKADLVIEIPLRFQDAEALAEDGGDHFLGAGLADAAGDADHRDRQGAPVILRQPLDGLQAGVHQDAGPRRVLRQPLAEDCGGSFGENRRDKAVPVHPGALYRHKEAAGLRLAAVDDDAADLPVLQRFIARIDALAGAGDLI